MKPDSPMTQQNALHFLREAGEKPDEEIDLTEGALALAVLDRPGVTAEPYRTHLSALVSQAKTQEKCSTLDDELRVIRRVLVVHNKYHGDEEHFEDLRNANLTHVIDRREGAPIPLGIIYLHIAKALGWTMQAVDFAGHFFLKLTCRKEEVLLDPFRAGQTCSATYLEDLLQSHETIDEIEPEEEDTPQEEAPFIYTVSPTPLTNRQILLRLQTGIKRRYLEQNKIDQAITTLQRMILLAPRNEDYWRELGYLQAERGSLRAAITALEVVCDLSAEVPQTEQTKDLLKQLRRQLN